MTRSQPPEAAPGPVPCAANPGDGAARYLHPEGICACFHGGPAPVRVLAPEIAVLADRPGVFDSAGIGQASGGPGRAVPVAGRVHAWLRRLFRR